MPIPYYNTTRIPDPWLPNYILVDTHSTQKYPVYKWLFTQGPGIPSQKSILIPETHTPFLKKIFFFSSPPHIYRDWSTLDHSGSRPTWWAINRGSSIGRWFLLRLGPYKNQVIILDFKLENRLPIPLTLIPA